MSSNPTTPSQSMTMSTTTPSLHATLTLTTMKMTLATPSSLAVTEAKAGSVTMTMTRVKTTQEIRSSPVVTGAKGGNGTTGTMRTNHQVIRNSLVAIAARVSSETSKRMMTKAMPSSLPAIEARAGNGKKARKTVGVT
jgi:hypothetical protein